MGGFAHLDNKPVSWFTLEMELKKSIGIFEAKTHFSQICDQVSHSGQPLLVERRGKPLVMITPVALPENNREKDILTTWEEWESAHPEDLSDFPDVTTLRVAKDIPALD